jgi:threonine/homoserine/homoserine lactone efflux protein
MLGNVLNPKMGIFYVSFLPQFIPAGHSPFIWTFILVSIHVLIGTLWSVTLILSTQLASGLLKKKRVIMAMDRATGGLFLCFAARLAFSHR